MVACEKEKNCSKVEVLRERDAEKALGMDSNREPILRKVTIAGRYCESGDIIAEDVFLPDPKPLDILARRRRRKLDVIAEQLLDGDGPVRR